VRIWRLADGTPIGDPLELGASVQAVSCHGDEMAIGSLADPHPPSGVSLNRRF